MYRLVLPIPDVDAALYDFSISSMLCGGVIVLITRPILSFWVTSSFSSEAGLIVSGFDKKYADAPPIATTRTTIPIILLFNKKVK